MKILVICSNLIGDTILSTGVFNFFKKKYPNAKFTFVIGPTARPLLLNFSRIERVITIKKSKFNFHWIKILRKCFPIASANLTGTALPICVYFGSSLS